MELFRLEFLGQITSFARFCWGTAPSPLACVIRYVLLFKRGWGLRDTSEKWPTVWVLGGISSSCRLDLDLSMYADLRRIKRGNAFPSWHHFQVDVIFRRSNTFSMVTLELLADYRTAAVSLIFAIVFLGQIPLFEHYLQGASRPTLSALYLPVNAGILFRVKIMFSISPLFSRPLLHLVLRVVAGKIRRSVCSSV